MTKFIRPLNDIVFKTLWLRGNKDVLNYLKRMTEYALDREIGDFNLGPNETGIINIDSIKTKVDILLKTDRGRINVELNNPSSKKSIIKSINKSMIYLSFYVTTYYDQEKLNDKYVNDIQVEQVNFNNYRFMDNPMIEKVDYAFTDLNYNLTKDGIKIHDIYLPRMVDLCYNSDKDVYKDFALLRCTSYEKMEEYAKGNKEREAVINMLKELTKDSELMTAIDLEEYYELLRESDIEEGREEGHEEGRLAGLEEGRAEGRLAGLKEGRAEGKEAAIKEAVINLFNNNVDKEIISKSLNITLEEIDKILEEQV